MAMCLTKLSKAIYKLPPSCLASKCLPHSKLQMQLGAAKRSGWAAQAQTTDWRYGGLSRKGGHPRRGKPLTHWRSGLAQLGSP